MKSETQNYARYFFDGLAFYADELEHYYAWRTGLDTAAMLIQQGEGVLAFVGHAKAPASRVVYYHKRQVITLDSGVKAWRVNANPYECLYNSLFNGHVRAFEAWRFERMANFSKYGAELA